MYIYVYIYLVELSATECSQHGAGTCRDQAKGPRHRSLLLLLLLIIIIIMLIIIMISPVHGTGLMEITANLSTKISDFRGLDPSRILNSRGGILMSIGNSPESLSQAILAGIILVGRLGVRTAPCR